MNSLFFGPMEMRPGMTVLTMGTGGVSCAAIQVFNLIPSDLFFIFIFISSIFRFVLCLRFISMGRYLLHILLFPSLVLLNIARVQLTVGQS